MHGWVALIADAKPAEVVQVGEASFDDPAVAAEPGAVGDAAAGDDGLDVASPQQAAVLVEVVAAVGQQQVGLLPRPPDLAGDRAGVQRIE